MCVVNDTNQHVSFGEQFNGLEATANTLTDMQSKVFISRLDAKRTPGTVKSIAQSISFRKSINVNSFIETREHQITKNVVRFSEMDIWPLFKMANWKPFAFPKMLKFGE